MKRRPSTNSAFTLIELLVVIGIITLLSSIVISSVQSSRVKARDTKRIQEIKQISIALELYYQTYGVYPMVFNCGSFLEVAKSGSANFEYDPTCDMYPPFDNVSTHGDTTSSWKFFKYALSPFASTLPVDPVNTINQQEYRYFSNTYEFLYTNGLGQPINRSSNDVPEAGKTYGAYDLWTILEDPTNPLRCGVKNYQWKDSLDYPEPNTYSACPDGDDGSPASLMYFDH